MAALTYLTAVQKLRQEAEIPGTGPSTVVNQTGQARRLVDWVKDAYEDIQNRHDNWRWLRSEFSLLTVAGTSTYASTACTDDGNPITRFTRWWPRDDCGFSNLRCYLQSGGVGGETWLVFLPWSRFRSIYQIGTQNNGQPAHFTIDPQNRLVLGPTPNDVYVLTGEYQKSPQVLAADADVPELPAQFHRLIVLRAMEMYGANAIAQEVLARAMSEGGRMMRALENNQLPEVTFAEPLA